MSLTLQLERAEGIATLTLTRPERLNAMSRTMFRELAEAASEIADDAGVSAVVVTGAGRGFSAGADIADLEWAAHDLENFMELQESVGAMAVSLSRIPKPVVAAVNGPAVGGGLALALAADLRVASAAAVFSAPFLRIGLSGCDAGISWLLPRVVGLGHASDLLFTGRTVDVDEALRIGLVNRVVHDALSGATELAREIASYGALPGRLTKQALRVNAATPSLEGAVELENRNQALASRGPDHAAGIADLLQRHPRATG